MKTEDFKDIIYIKDDETGIVTVVLNTPERKNAMSPYSFYELYWAIDTLEKDESAGAMIITGATNPGNPDPQKEAFSSGGYFYLSSMKGLSEEIRNDIDLTDIAQKRITLKMYNCDKPIIAAINGLAIGAGYTMPLSGADLIYMSEYAWIQLPFTGLGIVGELASSFLLPQQMGLQKAKEIVYFSKKVSAQEALELGMVNAVLPHDQMLSFVREQTLRLIPPRGAGFAVRQMKQAFNKPFISALTQALDLENEKLNALFKTSDFVEALAARMEKRAPIFQGK